MVTAQDLLSLGGWARMNVPSRAGGNWQWRYLPGQFTETIQMHLLELTTVFGRLPEVEQLSDVETEVDETEVPA